MARKSVDTPSKHFHIDRRHRQLAFEIPLGAIYINTVLTILNFGSYRDSDRDTSTDVGAHSWNMYSLLTFLTLQIALTTRPLALTTIDLNTAFSEDCMS